MAQKLSSKGSVQSESTKSITSSKPSSPNSSDVSSAKSLTGAFATEAATKTTTTTTTGGEQKNSPTSEFIRLSGLLYLDTANEGNPVSFFPHGSPQTVPQPVPQTVPQNVPTVTVGQSVDAKEVVAINNGSANHGKLAERITLEKPVFDHDFPLATQTHKCNAKGIKGTQSPKSVPSRTPPWRVSPKMVSRILHQTGSWESKLNGVGRN
ncbi:hypothetical protein JCM33374_g6522 [Metschnikowia sp. JCM 33374]|nr:hypothetical protein JCM33374_g6522 [Metschnikowia sp. JCM 33374]